jgi:L-lactate utilization protein LutB
MIKGSETARRRGMKPPLLFERRRIPMAGKPVTDRNEKAGKKVVAALKARYFDAYYCATGEEAKKKALSLIKKTDVISWGGCMTAEEIGLMDVIREKYKTIDRDKAKSREERLDLMRQAFFADVFISGTNAITEDGQLINIDGNGNRVAAMTFGPKSVIIVASMKKVMPTVMDAMARARAVAATTNAQRFEIKTPCKMTGICADCNSPDSICNYFERIRRCNPPKKIKVILIGEDFGY